MSARIALMNPTLVAQNRGIPVYCPICAKSFPCTRSASSNSFFFFPLCLCLLPNFRHNLKNQTLSSARSALSLVDPFQVGGPSTSNGSAGPALETDLHASTDPLTNHERLRSIGTRKEVDGITEWS